MTGDPDRDHEAVGESPGQTGDERDRRAGARDERAAAADLAAQARDTAAGVRDKTAETRERAGGGVNAAAASDRQAARGDRRESAADRSGSAADRLASRADRSFSAAERDQMDDLRDLDALKNEFMAVLAHDLHSPLTVIAGMAEMLQARGMSMSDAERVMFLERIVLNARRLVHLAGEMLDGARIASGDFAYDLTTFDLVDVVRSALQDVETTQPGRACRLDAAEALPLAFGDRDRCWRVVANLLTNAFKYSPGNTPVIVTVTAADDELEVGVHDLGGGIEPSDIPRLFRKFSRVAQSGGPQVQGTGLGLFISKQLVEGQGGRMWAQSKPGEGSMFSFTVPTAAGRT